MRFAMFRDGAGTGLAMGSPEGGFTGLRSTHPRFPGSLDALAVNGPEGLRAAHDALAAGDPVDVAAVTWLPPLANPGKIICIGLNYADHSADIDYIPANCDWNAGDHPPEDSFYVWGPTPPEDFAFNYEAAPADASDPVVQRAVEA